MSNSERDARAARRNQLREEAAEDGASSAEETDDHLEDDADSSSEEGLVGRRARMVMDAIIRVIPSDPVQQMLNDLVDSEGSTSGDSSSSEEDYQDYLDDLNDGRDADQMMAAANPRRLDDVDEVVVLVADGQFGQVVVVHNGMAIGHRGGQMAMLGPRDYVDGADQMQDVIDQLFNEAGQQAGAPPMPAERIQALESEVLEEEVEDMGSCPICVEAFQVGDQIQYPGCHGSRLHGCHPRCLQGWLSRHSTCPVCRQRLGNDGGGEQEQDGGEGYHVGDEELLDMSIDD